MLETASTKNLNEKIAEQNFLQWNEALKSGNPAEVAKLYSEDSTFLPTLSLDFKKGILGEEEYFQHFLEKKPVGKIIESEVHPLSENCFLHSGKYNFEIGSENNRTITEARFTFVWMKKNNQWQIIHHHSSLLPKA